MPRVIETEHYLRFERAGAVEETAHGLIAAIGGERLRIEAIRDDVVRLKISRGGTFDESPTYAVCADLDAERPAFPGARPPARRPPRLRGAARRRRRPVAHRGARRLAVARPVPTRRPPPR